MPNAEPAPQYAIVARSLYKTYIRRKSKIVALDHIDLQVPRGSIFGLLGPNGAGKSTFINILAGMVKKTSGSTEVYGFDSDRMPRRARASIGIVPQELSFDPFFTPLQSMELQAGLYGLPPKERRSMQILRALGLEDQKHAYTRELSGGMRRRLLIAKAMAHRPPILVLDEPTAGVDVNLRQRLWTVIRALHQQGVTILLTTHYLQEAQELCEHIAIIHHGKLVADEPTKTLLGRVRDKEMMITVRRGEHKELSSRFKKAPYRWKSPHQLLVRYRAGETSVLETIEEVRQEGLSILDISTRESDLEDIFLQLTRSPNKTQQVAPD